MPLFDETHADERIVIVGGGQAAAECAAALRIAKHRGSIAIFADESVHPYARPPLSKAYLSGATTIENLYILPPATYVQQSIDVHLDTRVEAIERNDRHIVLASGDHIPYDRLVLATGGRPRRLPTSRSEEASNVHTLRGLSDIDAMRPQFTPGARLVIIGGGYVGLEVAAVARKAGLEVTVLEAAPRLLVRVTSEPVSTFYQRIHTEHGVVIRTGCFVDVLDYDDEGNAVAIRLTDGSCIPADLVVVGIGLLPNTELAEAAGLPVDDGILVDEYCRTEDPHILAIGDCTRHPCAERGGTRRLESVPNAAEQARVAATTISGTPRSYDSVPWFWSDQYDIKLQSVGLSTGFTQLVVRGDSTRTNSFVVFYLREGVVCAADAVNSPREFVIAKKLVSARSRVPEADLSDVTRPIKDCLSTATDLDDRPKPSAISTPC
ncbi:NAD(P)/FAD-dependent oxidoreductase [Rhodococcoides fascians]|uniref:NAD(P)/FAD-dependent oxidoreductase n=1 Tax=Rhodococcoides fascians TaxID=1828 RepID=UPI00068B82B7|nr:FAD-dependent oxidoreductase [Rhodococcus fascians]